MLSKKRQNDIHPIGKIHKNFTIEQEFKNFNASLYGLEAQNIK